MPSRIYGWPKNVLHWAGLDGSILDVAAAVRPGLAIVDGIVGMEGNGPIQGDAGSAGVLVFGTDPVAVDSTAAHLMGIDPERVGYLFDAGRFLGQIHPELIRQVGEDPGPLATPFRADPLVRRAAAGLSAEPIVERHRAGRLGAGNEQHLAVVADTPRTSRRRWQVPS